MNDGGGSKEFVHHFVARISVQSLGLKMAQDFSTTITVFENYTRKSQFITLRAKRAKFLRKFQKSALEYVDLFLRKNSNILKNSYLNFRAKNDFSTNNTLRFWRVNSNI